MSLFGDPNGKKGSSLSLTLSPHCPVLGDAGAFVALFRFHGPFLSNEGHLFVVLPKNASSHKNQQILSFQQKMQIVTNSFVRQDLQDYQDIFLFCFPFPDERVNTKSACG